MKIPAGKLVFLVGSSGSGKSTISNIILRMYDISSGLILVDGCPIGTLSSKWLRENITVVEQQSVLFNTTIEKNILLGNSDKEHPMSDEEMAEVIDFALLQTIIDTASNGLDTVVGIGGSKLSGGQRQRIALARARIRDTAILILDESVSALDSVSRDKIMLEIRKWRHNKTTIIITHEIEQIRPDDYVFVLADGRTISHGLRRALNDGPDSPLASPTSPTSPWSPTSRSSRPKSSIIYSPFSDYFDLESKDEPASPKSLKRMTMPVSLEAMFSKRSYVPPAPIVDERPVRYSQFTRNSVFRPQSGLYFAPPIVQSFEYEHDFEFRDPYKPTITQSSGIRPKSALPNYNFRKSLYIPDFPIPTSDSLGAAQQESTFMKYISSSESSNYRVSTLHILSMCYNSIDQKWLLWLGVMFTALNGALTPVFSFVVSNLMAQMTPGLNSDSAQLYKWIGIALAVAIADGLTAFSRTLILGTVGDRWIKDLRTRAFKAVLNQDVDWYTQNQIDTNDLTLLLMSYAEDLRVLVTVLLNIVTTTTSLSLICVIWVMVLGWKLCMVGIAMVPIFYFSSMFAKYILVHWEGKCIFLNAIAEEIIHETVAGIRTLRILGLEKVFVAKFDEAVTKYLKVKYIDCVYSGLGFGVGQMVPFITQGILLWYGMKLIADGTYAPQHILTVFTILFFCISSVGTLLTAIPEMHNTFLTALRFFQILNFDPNLTQEKAGAQSKVRMTAGSVAFSNVHFSYVSPGGHSDDQSPEGPGSKRQKVKALIAPQASKQEDKLLIKVLNSFTAVIPSNKTTAIIGPSGSGKSTIVNLLTKLYCATGGSIKIDGVDIIDIDTDILRQEIAVVGQMPLHFFGGTIFENITFALNRPVTLEQVRAVCKDCAIDEFIFNLPEGYETRMGGSTGPVSSGGTSLLSGGQMQRIGIARALIRQPRLLILDECTSGLDQLSTTAIKETLETYKKRGDITILIITHQQDVAKIADMIITMNEGRVVRRSKR